MSDEMTLAEAQAELAKLGTFGRAIAKAREVGQALTGAEQVIADRTALGKKLGEDNEAALAALNASRAEAAAVREQTERECRAAVAKAQAAAEDVKQAAAKALQSAEAEVALAKAQAADIRAQGAAVQAELDAARAELAQVQAAIADAKAEALRRFA